MMREYPHDPIQYKISLHITQGKNAYDNHQNTHEGMIFNFEVQD